MTNQQFRNVFLRSEINKCLDRAKLCLVSRVPARNFQSAADAATAQAELNRTLAYARQLPANPKHRAIRAHIVSALLALELHQ